MTDGFADILIRWYADNHRRLPWRETSDPYLIWLSEVILQQTRVAQGLDYFRRFVARFPDVRSLAEAPQDEVLKLWQGLGYYSRARSLHAAAKDIMARFGGRFPEDYEAVRSLCGVGDYTAAAICSFAYELPYAAVDGNVYRVLSRVYDVDLPVDDAAGKRYFAELAQSLLDPVRPGLQNQATMEFGALQCVPQRPDCGACPLADRCLAQAHGTVGRRPVKRGKSGRAAALLQLLVHPLRRDIVVAAAYREGYLAQPVRISADRDRCGGRVRRVAADFRVESVVRRRTADADRGTDGDAAARAVAPDYLRLLSGDRTGADSGFAVRLSEGAGSGAGSLCRFEADRTLPGAEACGRREC